MLHFIGFIFILILAVLLIGLSLIAGFISRLFGGSKHGSGWRVYTTGRQSNVGNGQSAQSSSTGKLHEPDSGNKRKKVFSDDEGEYVDFEEVKD